MSAYQLEICVDTAAGLRIAAAHGADRIELCDALSVGGLTPSAGLMRLASEVASEMTCPVRAMIRPRAGDFTYDRDEIAIMRHDMAMAAHYGLSGVVFGANQLDGRLDTHVLRDLADHARGLGLAVALHRSFDLAPDPVQALEDVIALGFVTVLTSGGAKTAAEGAEALGQRVAQADARLEILAGSGVTAGHLARLLSHGVTSIHASCRAPVGQRSLRAVELGYAFPDQRDTDAATVAALRSALDDLSREPRHVVC